MFININKLTLGKILTNIVLIIITRIISYKLLAPTFILIGLTLVIILSLVIENYNIDILKSINFFNNLFLLKAHSVEYYKSIEYNLEDLKKLGLNSVYIISFILFIFDIIFSLFFNTTNKNIFLNHTKKMIILLFVLAYILGVSYFYDKGLTLFASIFIAFLLIGTLFLFKLGLFFLDLSNSIFNKKIYKYIKI